MKHFLKKNQKIIVAAILAFMFVVSVLNANNDSAIFDETAHIGAAYSYVSQHEMRLNPEHPPLIKDMAGFPLLFMNLNFNVDQAFWKGEMKNKWDEGQWESGRYLLFKAGNNPDKIIFWSRLPIALLSLLLGFFIFFWTKKLGGTIAGLLALSMYAFDPNILGHNHFVTTDLGIAAFTTFSFYFFLKFIKNPSWKNVFLGGLFLGLVQLAKFSSIMVFPIFGLILILYPLIKLNKDQQNIFKYKFKKLGEYLGKGIIAFAFSMVIVWIAYFANTFNMSKDIVSQTIEANFPSTKTDNIKNVYTNKILHSLNSNAITRPISTYGIGMSYVFRRVSGGNGAYFLGQVSSTAFPAYFPTVFAIKEPLPNLFLMLSAIFILFFNVIKNTFSYSQNWIKEKWQKLIHFLRTDISEVAISLFVILYAYISITGNLNIGLRHLFPIFPFAYILTAKTITTLLRKLKNYNFERVVGFSVFALVLFLIFEAASSYPYYMSYFNQIAGGPKNGFNYVTDSNADWGQDLKRLKSFLNDHPEIDKIRVDYFGGADTKYYLGDKYLPWYDSKRPLEEGWYAIAVNYRQGSIYDKTKKDSDTYRWTMNLKPDYQAGTAFLIYHLTPEKIKELNQ